VLDDEGQVLARSEGIQADNVNLVVGLDLVVAGGFNEGESKHTLLLQVGLVDTSEGAGDDSETTKESGLEGGVLTRGTFTVVVVTDNDPLDATVTVVRSGLRNSAVLAGNLVLDLVRLVVLNVDGTNQAVLYKTVSYEPLNHQKIDSSH
jgi:hypothetical protein